MRAEERWKKPRPSCNRTDRSCRIQLRRASGLTSGMVNHYERTCRTFNKRKSK